MPNRSREWQVQIKEVEREWMIARLALERFQKDVSADPTLLDDPLRIRDVRRTRERLEGTYLIRLFAEFETGVRSFWRTLRRTRPQTKTLLDSVGARRGISARFVDAVQQVRVFRNHLVHETSDGVEEFTSRMLGNTSVRISAICRISGDHHTPQWRRRFAKP